MKYEYLLFNAIVIAGPVVSHFSQQIRNLSDLRLKLLTNGIVLIPYIIWDVLVTGIHWHFNDAYICSFRLLGLPIEECFFFITVPFGCLLVWETLPNTGLIKMKFLRYLRPVLYSTLPIGIWVFSTGMQYTGLVLCSIGIVGLVDTILGIDLLLRLKTYLYLAIIFGLIVVFNGYLTARPVVLYGETYQVGFRIWTIPVEDFGYGFTLMLFNAILYEKLKAATNEK